MIPGYRVRVASHSFGPSVGRNYEKQIELRWVRSLGSPVSGLPFQFLDAWFLDEWIIVEAPGYPSAEDERPRRGLPTDGRAMRSW